MSLLCYLDYITFQIENLTFIIAIAGSPRAAYNFIAIIIKLTSQVIYRYF